MDVENGLTWQETHLTMKLKLIYKMGEKPPLE